MKQSFSPLQVKTALSIWQSGVKSAKRLVGLLARAVPLVVGTNSLGWVKACFVFSKFVISMKRSQGDRGLAIYLKTCNVLLMQSIGQGKRTQPRLVGAAVACSSSGLPRVIPGNHRQRIRQGDRGAIRLWLGFFTLYRVLDYKGKMSFKTVTDPGVEISSNFISSWTSHCERFRRALEAEGVKPFRSKVVLSRPSKGRDVRDFARIQSVKSESVWCPPDGILKNEILDYNIKLVPLMTSSPNTVKVYKGKAKGDEPRLAKDYESSVSVFNIVEDCVSWLTRPTLIPSLITILVLTRSSNLLFAPLWEAAFWKIGQISKGKYSKRDVLDGKVRGTFGELGKLALVEEPGKLRVVAMVDCITQWVLYPLHRYIFDKILRVIPQDGLYDQLGPVRALIDKLRALGLKNVYSYDLSAATDRLPVVLQEILLGQFVTPEFASHWRNLLVGRAYKLPNRWKTTYGTAASIRYSVGQPMGAYSSWAMLALVHHAIVQFAASRAKVSGWFNLYAVLGDDIVIGDRAVAAEYCKIMSEIGVKIGFNKSIVSSNLSLEFAKRFFYKGEEVTPLPLAAVACAWLGVTGVPEVVKASEARTGTTLSLYQLGKAVGLGFRAATSMSSRHLRKLPKKARSIALLLARPGTSKWSAHTLWDWYRLEKISDIRKSPGGWGTGVKDVIMSRILSVNLPKIRISLFNAFKGFHLDKDYYEAIDGWDGCENGLARWFEDSVASVYRAPMVESINSFDAIKSRVRDTSPMEVKTKEDDIYINLLLESLDTIENLAARLPRKVSVTRNMQAVMQAVRVRPPKTLTMWKRINRALDSSWLTAEMGNPQVTHIPLDPGQPDQESIAMGALAEINRIDLQSQELTSRTE